MALLDILLYPDPRLRKRAKIVDTVDQTIIQLVDDMAETMYNAPGIGLAATQGNVHKRVIVLDISEHRDQLMVFINPVIEERDGETESEEGCLSVPGVVAPVLRAQNVVIGALDREGNPFKVEASELLSVCIQHEMDHLEGKVFVDYLSRLKQDRIRKRLLKEDRGNSENDRHKKAVVY